MTITSYPVPKFLVKAVLENNLRAAQAQSALDESIKLASAGALDGVPVAPDASVHLNLDLGVIEVSEQDPSED